MFANSSSSNDSNLPQDRSSTNSSIPVDQSCFSSEPYSTVITIFVSTNILLLPLYIFILHHGLQQWWQRRSASTSLTVSHSDCFTYHMVAMKMVGVFGCVLLLGGIYGRDIVIFLVGFFLFYFPWYGELSFDVLTCVERYLAVVHPITYLNLRNERGIRMRNISVGCVWLLCCAGLFFTSTEYFMFVDFSILFLFVTAITYCSLSVLRVLIRPGPGEQGGGRERVDQSKLRAFYTIVSILGVLLVKFVGGLVWGVLYLSGGSNQCVLLLCEIWFTLPSSLVLPLLFLHRAGKLVCCKNNVQ